MAFNWFDVLTVFKGRIRQMAAAFLCLAGSVTSIAAPVTFDFEDAAGAILFKNYEKNGVRFSPNTHRDGFIDLNPTGVWLGWDGLPCIAGYEGNLNWLGPASFGCHEDVGSWMYIDLNGKAFSLLAVDLIINLPRTFLSSKGGAYISERINIPGIDPYVRSEIFSGNDWTGVQWLLISGGNGGYPIGIDNLVLDFPVPEPSALSLSLLALATLAGTSRKRVVPKEVAPAV